MMDLEGLAELFRSESGDLLEVLSRAVSRLEGGRDAVALDEAFRAAHTLKGMAAVMGYSTVVGLAHGLEHLLESVRSGAVVPDREIVEALHFAADELSHVVEAAATPSVVPEAGFVAASANDSAEHVDAGGEEPVGARYVRVEQGRIDALIAAAADLSLARDAILSRAAELGDPETRQLVDSLGRAVSRVRDDAIRLRLAPMGELEDRVHRVVREAARVTGRRVNPRLEGGEVEIDRALLSDVAEVLTHLLRNAVDHGVEPPDVRVAAGKPVEGAIRILLSQDRETVAIRVSDDGRGIDRAALVARAESAGLRAADAGEMGDREVLELLTRPGFTTAEQVTELSGRGVGLDHVASRVRDLGGSLALESVAGQGTSFLLTLPKTLSLTKVLVAGCGGWSVGIPASMLERIEDAEGVAYGAGTGLEGSASEVVLDVDEVLGTGMSVGGGSRFRVVLRMGDGSFGIHVDRLVGMRDVVVKRFAMPPECPDVFAGAAVLGGGEICLVLDPTRMVGQWTPVPSAAGTLEKSWNP
jgi:two-component system, chemotaxis family, sensor kinase CheA